MYILKFKIALSAIILFAILGIGSVIAVLKAYYTIPSSGSIGTFVAQPSGAYKSEIRALFIHAASMINPDWSLITQTAKDYGISVLAIELLGNSFARYPSAIIPHGYECMPAALDAAHARGLELYISMNVIADGVPWEVRGQPVDGSAVYGVVGSDGSLRGTMCPTNPNSRQLLKDIVEEIVTKYDIDGFMFDYIRYDMVDECYCDYCRQKFIQDTGLTDVNWRTDVIQGGRYNSQFLEWRIRPITELVRDMRSWMLAIKPNLKFSAAVWSWEVGYPAYWRLGLGQDWTDWVHKGYLDWVAPMVYTTNLTYTRDIIRDFHKYATGGPEGEIPLVPFLATYADFVAPTFKTPQQLKDQIDLVRSEGADGFIIWRYGGPGDGEGSGAPDIRDYLSIIDRPPIFTLTNIAVTPGTTTATITWTTDLSATSRVEFNTNPLFNATFAYEVAEGFNYWDIDHVQGTILEDTTKVTQHSITLTGLTPGTLYYYRVQSKDQSGMATSKVQTFKL